MIGVMVHYTYHKLVKIAKFILDLTIAFSSALFYDQCALPS